MKNTISLFPILNQSRKSLIDYNKIVKATYSNHSNTHITLDSKLDTQMNQYQIIDTENGLWSHSSNDLSFNINVKMSHLDTLFGENGIAPSNAKIGVALMWKSQTSLHRGIEKIYNFDRFSSKCDINYEWKIKKSTLRSLVDVEISLYIHSGSSPIDSEKFLAHIPGTVIGTIDEFKLVFDGNGSLFPVVEYANKKDPLWKVECGWDNPNEDLFIQDNFAIYLNTIHADYELLNVKFGITNSPFYKEIICSALTVFMQTIIERNELDAILSLNTQTVNEGTIALVVYHFVNNLNFDTSSNSDLANSIRTHFKEVKGDKKND